MTIPVKYRKTTPAIASYDYENILSGTGYSIFYGAKMVGGSYILIDNVIYSNEITSSFPIAANHSDYIKRGDTDFEVPFNVPRVIKGNMILNIPMGIGRDDVGGTGVKMKLIGTVNHVDGVSDDETSLGSFNSGDFESNRNYDWKVMGHEVEIALTHFKRGDILRIKVECWGQQIGAATNKYVGIGHDPKSRDDDGVEDEGRIIYSTAASAFGETTMEVHVPFRIDI